MYNIFVASAGVKFYHVWIVGTKPCPRIKCDSFVIVEHNLMTTVRS